MSMLPLAVLIGMPAAGKTRLGREVAHLLDVPFADTDALIEQAIGMSISQYFREYGQDAFRQVEARIIRDLLDPHTTHCNDGTPGMNGGILALGGGAPMTLSTRQVLRQYVNVGGRVVYLQTNPQDAIERISWNNNRPMFVGSYGQERWMQLLQERDPVFRDLANICVRTHGAYAHLAAKKVRDMIMQRIIHITGEAIEPYDVRIGAGAMQLLPQILGIKPVRVALIHTAPVQRHSDRARTILRQAGYEVFDMLIPDAEAGKTVAVASDLWTKLAHAGFTRSDAIVGLGGGAATDVAGFVAATWMRGITYVNCPTSLLAMVDASTGGKTGINLDAGKNLVGSFYTPAGVLADTTTLETLPNDIVIEGLGEVVKSGFIADGEILRLLSDEYHARLLRSLNADKLDDAHAANEAEDARSLIEALIERSVRVKAYHVSQDLRESGLREFLNYGHTLGHAIEQLEHFHWRHGNAVAVGMVFAAQLSYLLGYLSKDDVQLHVQLLESLGLPTMWKPRSGVSRDELFTSVLSLMHRDKKARGNTIRMVILESLGHPQCIEIVDESALREAFNMVCR